MGCSWGKDRSDVLIDEIEILVTSSAEPREVITAIKFQITLYREAERKRRERRDKESDERKAKRKDRRLTLQLD